MLETRPGGELRKDWRADKSAGLQLIDSRLLQPGTGSSDPYPHPSKLFRLARTEMRHIARC